MSPFENNPEDRDLDAAPEGAEDEVRPDEGTTDPDAEQQDPESGPAADSA
jgi:hypothetical protein